MKLTWYCLILVLVFSACSKDSDDDKLEGFYALSGFELEDWRVCLVENNACAMDITSSQGLGEFWLESTWQSLIDTTQDEDFDFSLVEFELLEGDSIRVTDPNNNFGDDSIYHYELRGNRLFVDDEFTQVILIDKNLIICAELELYRTVSGNGDAELDGCQEVEESREQRFDRVSRRLGLGLNDTLGLANAHWVFKK